MRKFITILIYTLLVLLIGRNLTILPRMYFFGSPKTETERLETQIQRITSVSKGNYSIYFEDYNNKTSFGINEKQQHIAASVNKIYIVSALYKLASIGKVNLDEKVTIQKDDFQDYGTGSIRYNEDSQVYSLKTLSKLALKESDNTAAHVIAKKIGFDVIQKYIDSWGLTQTQILNNKTTVSDLAVMFKKIHLGEITSPSLTKELLSFLTDTTIEDRLPRLLSKDVTVYHKSGDAVGSIHDVGIIQDKKHTFFLGVLTSDVGSNEEETKKIIGELAKKTYEFTINQE